MRGRGARTQSMLYKQEVDDMNLVVESQKLQAMDNQVTIRQDSQRKRSHRAIVIYRSQFHHDV